jgi:hypothetical protein
VYGKKALQRTLQRQPHNYLPVDEAVDECFVCGLPNANARHNANAVQYNKRTRRWEYV